MHEILQSDILVHISSHTSNYCSLIPRKNLSETDTRRENNILKCWMLMKCASYCHSGYVMFRDIIGGENTRVDQIIVYITWFIHRHQITCGGSGSESWFHQTHTTRPVSVSNNGAAAVNFVGKVEILWRGVSDWPRAAAWSAKSFSSGWWKNSIHTPSWFCGIVGSDTPLDGAGFGPVQNQLDQCVYESSKNKCNWHYEWKWQRRYK